MLVHGDTKQEPRNWQPPGVTVQVTDTDPLVLTAVRTNPREVIRITCEGVYHAALLPMDDDASLLTTVLARSLNSNIEILTRVSDTDATRKALSAGADYVLSVPRVSARMVARELRGEDILSPASQIRLLRVPAAP